MAHTRYAAGRGIAQCGGFEVPTHLQRASHRNFKSKNHTRVISLLVSLRFRSSHESVPQGLANFGIRTLAAAFLLARDEVEQQSVRRKAGQRRRHAVGKAWNDHAAALLEAAIAVSRHLLGGALENARKSVGGEARARLKFGRHRAR